MKKHNNNNFVKIRYFSTLNIYKDIGPLDRVVKLQEILTCLEKDSNVNYTRRFTVNYNYTLLEITQLAYLVLDCYGIDEGEPLHVGKTNGLTFFCIVQQGSSFYVTLFCSFLNEQDPLFSIFSKYPTEANSVSPKNVDWPEKFTYGEFNNIVLYMPPSVMDVMLGDYLFNLLLLSMSFVSADFWISMGEKFFRRGVNYYVYRFYILPKQVGRFNFDIKNRDHFVNFYNFKRTMFLCNGFFSQPFLDFCFEQNLFSICGMLLLPKKNRAKFIYNFMQFFLPKYNVSFAVVHTTKTELYFWIGIAVKDLFLQQNSFNISFTEQTTEEFLQAHMVSVQKTKSINSFFFGLYTYNSFCKLKCNFIPEESNNFQVELEKWGFSYKTGLFFGPKFSLQNGHFANIGR